MAGFAVTSKGYAAIGDDINNENLDDYMTLTLQQIDNSTFLKYRGSDYAFEVEDDVEDYLSGTPKVEIGSRDRILVCDMEQDKYSKRFIFGAKNCDEQYLLPTLEAGKGIEVNLKYYSTERWDVKDAQDEINALLKSSNAMQYRKNDNIQGIDDKFKRDGILLVIGNDDEETGEKRKMHLFLNEYGIKKLVKVELSEGPDSKKRKSYETSIGMPAGTHKYRPFKRKQTYGDIMGHMGYTIMHCSY